MQIKSILIAYDMSPSAERALLEACYLAQKHEAIINVVYTLDADISQVFSAPLSHEWKAKVNDKVTSSIEAFYTLHKPHVKVSNIFVEIGEPHKVVVKKAIDLGCDLIVVGSHGRSVIGYALLGSVADKIVRYSPVPVLVSRDDRARSRDKILVPLDESPESERAIPVACDLAGIYSASVVLMYAVDVRFYDYVDDGTILRQVGDGAKKRLDALIAKHKLTEKPIIVAGSASHMILEIIKEDPKIGCVVMTTHGRTGFSHFILGSVTQSVVRYAPCDLLVVPSMAQSEKIRSLRNKLDAPHVTNGNVLL